MNSLSSVTNRSVRPRARASDAASRRPGGNEKNAFLSGINADLYKIVTHGISGGIVAIAGLIFAARLNSITASAGYELQALVAVVIGGVTFAARCWARSLDAC